MKLGIIELLILHNFIHSKFYLTQYCSVTGQSDFFIPEQELQLSQQVIQAEAIDSMKTSPMSWVVD